MNKLKHWLIGMGAATSLMLGNTAQSAIVVSVQSPTTIVSGPGANFSVNINVSGLNGAGALGANEVVQAYDLLLGYDANLLTATGVSFNNLGGVADTGPIQLSDLAFDPRYSPDPPYDPLGYLGSYTSAVRFSEIVGFDIDTGTLDGYQGDSLTLATISFAVKNVAPPIFSTDLAVIDYTGYAGSIFPFDLKGLDGVNPLLVSLADGIVTTQNQAVPEPATLLLVALGAGLMGRGGRGRERVA
ncbi:PEP-CTERM sorting domain-containing protein [Methylomagnum sp.]